MRAERAVARWVGPALLLVGTVATAVLAATGRLTWYVHPRYVVFTTALSLVGGLLVLAAVTVAVRDRRPPSPDGSAHDEPIHELHDHDTQGDHRHAGHDHADDEPVGGRLLAAGRLLVLIVAVLALLVVPPATLTSRVRTDREVVTSGRVLESADGSALAGADPAGFTVKDWAVLLNQGGPSAVLGKEVTVTGYLLDADDPDTVLVARMLVSCCAVDAQPLGIAVRVPGWRSRWTAGDWVQLHGRFAANPDPAGAFGAVVQPTLLRPVAEPRQPYVF